MIFVDFVVLRETFRFPPPKIRSRRHVGAGWILMTALVGMLLSQNKRIEVDYEELVFVKDSLDFLRILRLGQCQHEEDARLLRVVHHGAHKAFF